MIKYAQGDCGIEELEQVKEALEYGYFGLAYKVSELEKEIKNFLVTESEVVCVNTGTSALHLALDSIGVGPEDEVILPSFTFVSTAQVISSCGAKPIFVDITDDLVISPELVEKQITPRTKAIIVVHYNGQPVDMDLFLELAKKYNLRLIEDAAHAFGSTYKNRKIGSFGDITCFSFDSIKVMTCGEGGALVTRDQHVLETARNKRLLGMQRQSMTDINWKNRALSYDVVTKGYRYHMSNINAAIGLAQIKKVTSFINYRNKLVHIYLEYLKNSKLVEFYKFSYDTNANFMMVVKVKNGLRDKLKQYLLQNEIESNINYPPCHLFSFYNTGIELKNTEKVCSEILSLPLHTKLSENDVEKICSKIKDYENEFVVS